MPKQTWSAPKSQQSTQQQQQTTFVHSDIFRISFAKAVTDFSKQNLQRIVTITRAIPCCRRYGKLRTLSCNFWSQRLSISCRGVPEVVKPGDHSVRLYRQLKLFCSQNGDQEETRFGPRRDGVHGRSDSCRNQRTNTVSLLWPYCFAGRQLVHRRS